MKTQLYAVADAAGNIYPFSFNTNPENTKWRFAAHSSRFYGMYDIALTELNDEWAKCEERGDRVILYDVSPAGTVSFIPASK